MSKLIKQMLKKKQRSNFSTIEWELRNYKQTKKELELMREEVIMGRKHSETPAEGIESVIRPPQKPYN